MIAYIRIKLDGEEWPDDYDVIVSMLQNEPAVKQWETIGIKKESF